MSSRPLLGEFVGESENESAPLRRRISQLERLLEESQSAAKEAISEGRAAIKTVQKLRHAFGPMYEAMRPLFEGLELSESTPSGSGLSPKWEMMKSKLGRREVQIIDVLQHGPMNAKQLRAAVHWDIKTVYRVTATMKNAGLLDASAGKFSLREI